MSTKWHKGPPPSVGWWPASFCGGLDSYRWWNGKKWSVPVSSSETAEIAGDCARARSANLAQSASRACNALLGHGAHAGMCDGTFNTR